MQTNEKKYAISQTKQNEKKRGKITFQNEKWNRKEKMLEPDEKKKKKRWIENDKKMKLNLIGCAEETCSRRISF